MHGGVLFRWDDPSLERAIYLQFASSLDRVEFFALRCALVLVFFWIGGLKLANYEADHRSIGANSSLMRLFYLHPHDYRMHMSSGQRAWNQNRTYSFSQGLGLAIITIGFLIASYSFAPRLSALGSLLLVFMSMTTLSFLVTSPEAWVPALGDTAHGFPFLSGVGRLIIKDAII